MRPQEIISGLARNAGAIEALLRGLSSEQYPWKPVAEQWSLLEVICHLYDEEREDFRARIRHIWSGSSDPMLPIDPPAWVLERNYLGQDWEQKLEQWLEERAQSILYLQDNIDGDWQRVHKHAKLGDLSAYSFLANWLAHDYLHIRQIIRLQYQYLVKQSSADLNYAGQW